MIYTHVLGITSLLCFSEILEQLVAMSVNTVDHRLVTFLVFRVEHTPTQKCLNNSGTDLHKTTASQSDMFFIYK